MSRRQRLTPLTANPSPAATNDPTTANTTHPTIERDLGGGLASQQWVAGLLGVVEAASCAGGRLVGAPQASLPQQA